MLLAMLLPLLLAPQDTDKREVHILSTGGCIIDPRPKPTLPGGGPSTKASVPDEEIFVTYYQDRADPDSDVVWQFEFKAGDHVRLEPFDKETAVDQFIGLDGTSEENVRLSYQDKKCKLTRYIGDVPQSGLNNTFETGHVWNSLGGSIDPESGKATAIPAAGVLVSLDVFGKTTGFRIVGKQVLTQPAWLLPGGPPNGYRLVTLRPAISGYAVRSGSKAPMDAAGYEMHKEQYQVLRYAWVDVGSLRTITYELSVMPLDEYQLGLPQRRGALKEADGTPVTLNGGNHTIDIIIDRSKKVWSINLDGKEKRGRIPLPWSTHGSPLSDRVGGSYSDETAISVSVDLQGLPVTSPIGFTLHAKTISALPHWVVHKNKKANTTGTIQLN